MATSTELKGGTINGAGQVQLPVREDIEQKTDTVVYVAGSAVIAAVVIFIAVFW